MKLTSVIALLLASATAIQVSQTNMVQRCTSGCPNTDTAGLGFGKISSRSKGQSKNTAKADNQYEEVNEALKYSGSNNEAKNGQSKESQYVISKEYITINGNFLAEQNIKEDNASKEAETGKAADCFKRESQQHLNEIRGQNLPEPLSQRGICDCNACAHPLQGTSRYQC